MSEVRKIVLKDYADDFMVQYTEVRLHDDGYAFIYTYERVKDSHSSNMIMLRPEELRELAKALRDPQ